MYLTEKPNILAFYQTSFIGVCSSRSDLGGTWIAKFESTEISGIRGEKFWIHMYNVIAYWSKVFLYARVRLRNDKPDLRVLVGSLPIKNPTVCSARKVCDEEWYIHTAFSRKSMQMPVLWSNKMMTISNCQQRYRYPDKSSNLSYWYQHIRNVYIPFICSRDSQTDIVLAFKRC